MSDQDDFERILASLHDAMLDDTLWPTTSALIDEACGIEGNSLLVCAGSKDALQVTFSQAYYRGYSRRDWTHEYRDIYLPIDERAPRFRQLPDSRLVHITDLYTAEELKTSPTYNEAMPRYSAQDSLNVRLAEPDGSHCLWAFADPVTPGGWADSQLTLIKGLLPHLWQFVRVRQALVGAKALGASVTDLLDTTRIGVIHLDQRGQVVEANDRARAILRHGDGLSDWGEELRARVPADHARLQRLVAAALPPAGTTAVSGSMLLRRASGLPPFVVYLKPVGGRQPDFGARHVAALVLIVEPGHQGRLDTALVAQTLGLTLTESQIAVWVAEGKTVQDIAALTGLQTGSVYWHLRQAYHRLGVTRQVDLVRIVLSLAEFV